MNSIDIENQLEGFFVDSEFVKWPWHLFEYMQVFSDNYVFCNRIPSIKVIYFTCCIASRI